MTMKSSIYVDISLLAILFALHFTRNPKAQNFKLGVLFLLFSHVIITSKNCHLPVKQPVKLETLGMDNDEDEDEDDSEEVIDEVNEIPNETANVIKVEDIPDVRKSVSDGKFDRNFSVPPGSKILSNPNPIVSDNTNERLSNARTNFWSGILGSGLNDE